MNKKKIFEIKARTFFDFLVNKFGFKEIAPKKDKLSYGLSLYYVLNDFFVEVFYIFRGDEVGVNIGRTTTNGEEKFSFHMYLGTTNPPIYYKLGYSIANKEEHIAELLRIYSTEVNKDYLKIQNDFDRIFEKLQNAKKTGFGLCPPYYEQKESIKIASKFI